MRVLCWQQIQMCRGGCLQRPLGIGRYARRRSSTLLVTGKAQQYINCVPLPARHSLPPEATGISVGRDLAWSRRRRPADAPPVGPGQARHDDEAQLGGVTFDGRLPSIRHFRAGRNPDGRLIRPAIVATVHFPRSSIR